jgi:hypothetical protein
MPTFREISRPIDSAAWAHKDGHGFNVTLDALPVNGRIVLREPKAEEEPEKPVKKR